MAKLTLPNPNNLKDLARRWPPGRSQPLESESSAEPAEPKPRHPCPCSSCCPTWRTTARCAWTG